MRSAIIDIGYNAIRAVVYERESIGSPEIFNEKFKNDVLNLLEFDNLDIKHQTYLSFQYLIHIFNKLSVTSIKCVATEVLRGHPKADEFKNIILKKFGFEIDIISGEKEAYLTAAGLINGINKADGVAADLGGGSLELASIANKSIGSLKSLPLGTKKIKENNLQDLKIITNIIIQEFGANKYKNLYLIGGALRFIGRYYMDFVHYPLKNLHYLEIPRPDFEIYLEKLDHIQKIKPFGEQRKIEYNAILIAKALVKVFSPEKIVISNYGLKEGVRFISLPKVEQEKNIIYERIKELVNLDENICKIEEYNKGIVEFLVMPDSLTVELIDYAIMLAQFNKNIDKTLRANYAVEFVLAADIPFCHRERLMLALTLAFAYSTKTDISIHKLAKKMLNKRDYYNSQIIGNYIRIAKEVDGPEFQSPSFTLKLKDRFIEIKAREILPRLIFEKVCDRLKNIAYARKYASQSSNQP